MVEKTSFILSGERPWIYLCTSVNKEFIHLWWVDISLEDLKISWKCTHKNKTSNNKTNNQSLKSTDLHQTQRFIGSWSISTALVPYTLRFSQVHWYYNSNIISKLYCTYRNHVAIPREKKHRHKKRDQTIAIRQLLWIINR